MRNKMIKIARSFFVVLLLFLHASANAAGGCEDNKVISGKMITDVCWDCMFPIVILGTNMGGGTKPDGAATNAACICYDNNDVPLVGVLTAMWEPSRLIEFQRLPGCISSLGGHRLPFDVTRMGHHTAQSAPSASKGFFTHYHYLSFPLMFVLDMFSKGHCNPDGYMDIDLMYLSELDPTWNDDTLAFFTSPEASVVANPVAITSCTADATSSIAGKPIDSMFWCAGTWGGIYPLSGHVTGGMGTMRATSLESVRVLAALSRRGLMWNTMGNDAMCGGEIATRITKSQYKFTTIAPVAETKKAHMIGEPTFKWARNRLIPGVSEDPTYLLWRWNDCCNTN